MNETFGQLFKLPEPRIHEMIGIPMGFRFQTSLASHQPYAPDAGYADVLAFRRAPKSRILYEQDFSTRLDGQKMSKSYGNTIEIFGDEKETRKRVMSIVTDSTPVEAPKDPKASSIYQLYSLFASEAETAAMGEAFQRGGTGYGDFKKQLSKSCGIISRRCGNAAKKSWPTNHTSTTSSRAAPNARTKWPSK